MQRRIALLLLTLAAMLAAIPQSRAQGGAPVISAHPTNRVAFLGGSASFSVNATGAFPLIYRWWKDGSVLPSPTNRFLNLTNLQPSHAGSYWAVASNLFGAATSRIATLELVVQSPSIIGQPQDASLCPNGSNAFLNITATGSPPLAYQWRFNDANIPGATTTFLTVPGQAANIGDYSVEVSNSIGSVTSRVARVQPGIIILQQPANRTVIAGTNVSFNVVVRTCSSPRFQWRYFGIPLPGSTNGTLSYASVRLDQGGDYDVVITDAYSSITSVVARLVVNQTPILITSQPFDLLNWNDTNAFFSIDFFANPTPTIQWQRNGIPIPGATGQFYSFPITLGVEGGYAAVLSNASGSVTSRVATLTLLKSPPFIPSWGHPANQVLCPPPAVAYLNVSVDSPAAFRPSYQWRLNGTNLPGEVNPFVVLTGLPEQAGDYDVVASNPFGSVTSNVARVTSGPIILQEPEDTTLPDGGQLFLSFSVGSCAPLLIQWKKNGVNIPGANLYYLNLYPVSLADAGDYYAVATNVFGSVTSRVARVEIEQFPPFIDENTPVDQTVYAGNWVTFDIFYDLGAPEATFQWLHNGLPIPGATSPSLSFIPDSPGQQGRYSVVLSNIVGVVTSRVARLTLLFSPPFLLNEPEDLALPDGDYAYFFASAEGSPWPVYQWFFNGVPLPDETNNYLNFRLQSTNQVGGYSVTASNLLGVVTSREAMLTRLVYPPGFLFEPQDVFANAGNRIYLYTTVTGAPPPSFQWFHNGGPLTDETNEFLTFIAGFSNQIGGYSLVASNELGLATSRVATVQIILQPLSFVVQPLGANLLVGESATLYVVLANNLPAQVQWQRDGIDLPGATSARLYFRRLTTNDSGNYVAIARNDLGSITSVVARLDVRLPGPLDHWSWRRPLPQGNHLEDVAIGNGRHVSVGTFGGVAISTNGTDWWDGHQDGVTSYRSEVAFGNGVFVTLGNEQPQTSTNGLDWVDGDFGGDFSGAPFFGASIAFGNGRFVAVNYYEPRVATSTNGVDWELHATAPAGGMAKVVFAGGMFMAPALSFLSPGNDGLFTSPDGIHWTTRAIPPNSHLVSVAYGNNLFVGLPNAQDYLVTSTNGIHWSGQSLPLSRRLYYTSSIAWGNGVWVVGGFGITVDGGTLGLEWSIDAIHWTAVPGIGTNSVREVLFDGTRFVAVGAYGFIAISTNGADWAITNPGSDLNLRGLSHANGLFLTVGNGGLIYTSPDGRDWTRRSSGTTANLRSSTFFGGRFIVVGGDDLTGSAVVLSSSDASHWESHVAQGSLYGVTHNGHRLVAVGDGGAVATSLDGLLWNNLAPFTAEGPPTTADLNAILWTGDRFLAVGKDGTIITSTNGLGWTSTGPGGGKNLKGIAYGNGIYVAVGNDARVFTSSDGRNWQRRILEPQRNFEDITFGGGRFLTVGENGALFTSDDGANWLRRVTVCNNDLRSILFAEGSYYAAGNNETILQSGQTDAALRITHGSAATEVLLELLGETGRAYRLQGSADLAGWTDLLTFTAGPGPTRHTDPSPAAGGWRFYRLISP